MTSPSLPRTLRGGFQGQLWKDGGPWAPLDAGPVAAGAEETHVCTQKPFFLRGASCPEGGVGSQAQSTAEGLRPWTGGCNRGPQALPHRPLLLSWTKPLGVGRTWESAGRQPGPDRRATQG